MDEDVYSIVLRDHESEELYIAEVRTYGDIERIKKESEKLTQESYEDDWSSDFYEELWTRTGLRIYEADILDI